MEQNKPKMLENVEINFITRRNRNFEVIARSFLSDSKKDIRELVQKCKYCFYVANLPTRASKEHICEICGKEYWATMHIPEQRICGDCGKEHNLCIICGGDINGEHRK